MTIIISQQDAASPRIGYENLFESATSVIASSEAAGFPKENAYDWRLYDWWKPATTGTHYLTAEFASAVTADYLAIFGHDLHKWGASARLQYGLPAQNLLTYSEQFDNAAWSRFGVLAFGSGSISNATNAPDGTLTADKIVEDTALTIHRISQTCNAVLNENITCSIYIKNAGRYRGEFFVFNNAATTNYIRLSFNLNTVSVSGNGGGNGVFTAAQIQSVGNDWYRIILIGKPDIAVGAGIAQVQLRFNDNTGLSNYTGDGISGYYVWGAQLEQAAQVGPYIKTEATPITSGTAWLDATTAQAPTTGKVIFTGFDSISAAKWRLKLVTPTGPASIGHVMFGNALIFPRGLPIGFEPPNLARKNEYLNNQGDTGAFLGRSLRRYGAETSIDLKLLDPAWVRETWHPFQKHAEKKPFIFSWDYLNHPDEAAFCWTDGDVPAPRYEHAMYMSVSMKVKALTELA